jgi:hypothetical protein
MLAEVQQVQLRVAVRASPDTHDHEVVLYGDDQNLVERFGGESIGLDPDDILTEPCSLLTDGPHECLIGRCECGVIGCGDVRVRVSTQGDAVVWADVHEPRRAVQFDRAPYRTEVQRALRDFSWETAGRTTERLIRVGVDRQRLAGSGLKFSWASSRASPGLITISLFLEPGPYQVLVRVPWTNLEASALADVVIALLAQSPSSWPDVEWLPQGDKLEVPAISGASWRRWRF